MEKIRLNVLGLSYGHSESGSYILLLGEQHGNRKLPIVVAPMEIQAIAVQLEGYSPPRPLMHDLFLNFSQSFGVELVETTITKIECGVFYAELLFFDGDKYVALDARPSDAVAIALRFRCPIFTTEAVLEEAGVVIEEEEDEYSATNHDDSPEIASLSKLPIPILESMLNEAVQSEDYELASLLRDELRKRSCQK